MDLIEKNEDRARCGFCGDVSLTMILCVARSEPGLSALKYVSPDVRAAICATCAADMQHQLWLTWMTAKEQCVYKKENAPTSPIEKKIFDIDRELKMIESEKGWAANWACER